MLFVGEDHLGLHWLSLKRRETFQTAVPGRDESPRSGGRVGGVGGAGAGEWGWGAVWVIRYKGFLWL